MIRTGCIVATCLGVLAIGMQSLVPATPKLIWNASASAPIGLYAVHSTNRFMVGDLVAVVPPQSLANVLDQRGYLPDGVPLMKRVAALPGQHVCRNSATVTVDGIEMAMAQKRDRFGRDLPVWRGCLRIADDDVFLLNWQHPDSLDGRYFGPLPQSTVIGRAIPLLANQEEPGG